MRINRAGSTPARMFTAARLGKTYPAAVALAKARTALPQDQRTLLRFLLFPTCTSENLRVEQRIKTGSNLPVKKRGMRDIDLVTNDTLGGLLFHPLFENQERDVLIALYREKMHPFLIRILDLVRGEVLSSVPHGFWTGVQGRLNYLTLFQYMVERQLGLKMREGMFRAGADGETEPFHQIDRRLFWKEQRPFLTELVGHPNWVAVLREHKLEGGLKRVKRYRSSFARIWHDLYPWAWDLTTPEGQHLHYDDFRQFAVYEGKVDSPEVWEHVGHVLECHLGLKMDEGRGVFDERLLPKNHAAFLSAFQVDGRAVTGWADLFSHYLDFSALLAQPPFCKQAEGLLAWRYPWAFDLGKPEHLHWWDFAKLQRFKTGQEAHAVFFHLAAETGLPTQGPLSGLVKAATVSWFNKVGLSEQLRISGGKTAFFRWILPEAFESGQLSGRHFHASRPTRWGKILAPYKELGKRYTATIAYYQYGLPEKCRDMVVRQESSDYAVVYRVEGKNYIPAYIIRLGPPTKRTTYVNLKKEGLISWGDLEFPDLEVLNRIAPRLLEKGKPPYRLPLAQLIEITAAVQENGEEILDTIL